MNEVKLKGNLGRDPEVQYLPSGVMVCKTSLATSNDYKDKKSGEWIKKPASWHKLVAFGKAAEMLSEFKKGEQIKVVGKIQYNEWTDKEGNKKYSTEINIWWAGIDEKKDEPPQDDDDVPF